MRKELLLSIGLFAVTSVFGQRISNVTFDGITNLGFAATRPTENSAAEADRGVASVVVMPNSDMSDVVAHINCGTEADVSEPAVLPADWTSVQTVKVQNKLNSDWSVYDVNCYVLTPVALPIEGLFPAKGTESIGSLGLSLKGWAPVACDLIQPFARLSSVDRGFFLAFSDSPKELTHTLFVTNNKEDNILEVTESADAVNWTTVVTYKNQGTGDLNMGTSAAPNIRTVSLKSDTRFVKYWFSKRNGGAIAIQNLSVSKNEDGNSIKNTLELNDKIFVQNNKLIISSNEAISNVEVIALNGQVVKNVVNPASEISVAEIASGCYIVKVTSVKGNTAVQKIVK